MILIIVNIYIFIAIQFAPKVCFCFMQFFSNLWNIIYFPFDVDQGGFWYNQRIIKIKIDKWNRWYHSYNARYFVHIAPDLSDCNFPVRNHKYYTIMGILSILTRKLSALITSSSCILVFDLVSCNMLSVKLDHLFVAGNAFATHLNAKWPITIDFAMPYINISNHNSLKCSG